MSGFRFRLFFAWAFTHCLIVGSFYTAFAIVLIYLWHQYMVAKYNEMGDKKDPQDDDD